MNPSFSPTVLANVNADGVDVGDVGHGGPHGCTGGPHVVEEENRHGGEAENTKPGHAQNVGEEHKLVRGRKKKSASETHKRRTLMRICPPRGGIPFRWCSGRRWWSWTRCAAPWRRWWCKTPRPEGWSRRGRKRKRCRRWRTASAVFCQRAAWWAPHIQSAKATGKKKSCLRGIFSSCHVTAREVGLTLRFQRTQESLRPNVEITGDACLWESSGKRQTASGDVSD